MSRFISAGTNEDPSERDGKWMKAQQEIEANRRRKDEEKERQDGKSLYEVLQANKGNQGSLASHSDLGPGTNMIGFR